MSNREPSIGISVNRTNPGEFFACCGLLELADRLWPGAEGWFKGDQFCIDVPSGSLEVILNSLQQCVVANTMTPVERGRLAELSAMSKKTRENAPRLEDERNVLDGMRRKAPISFTGPVSLRIDWFCDSLTRGFSLKTWAGQQSVLDITTDMFDGFRRACSDSPNPLMCHVRDVGLPFNFDSDLGAQGSSLDIGFSFDKLDGNEITRINRGCRPVIELLCFIGLQRFRPREVLKSDRFLYCAWAIPLQPSIAAAAFSASMPVATEGIFEFRMFQRSKDYYSFYPAQPFQGDPNE